MQSQDFYSCCIDLFCFLKQNDFEMTGDETMMHNAIVGLLQAYATNNELKLKVENQYLETKLNKEVID